MKKYILSVTIICLTLLMYSVQLKAETHSSVKALSNSAKSEVLVKRLIEIKEMDKSELTQLDKKQLRTEVLSIENQLKNLDGGIYLSVGAIIIIVLLLILIF